MDYISPILSTLYALFQPVISPESDPERVTQVFCLGIITCFVICLVLGFQKKNRSFLRFSQSTTTILGILGTFIGIYLGLKDFDTNDIEQSVPPLLSGLKTAFLTSIFGIGTSLFARLVISFKPLGSRRAAEGATVQNLADLLQDQIDIQKESHTESLAAVQSLANLLQETTKTENENHEQTLESLERIRASVSGDESTSLLTQVTRFREIFADKQNDLIKEFRDFAENMAQANSQKLIKALQEVMRDFNTRINEQLGDNFE